MNNKSYYQTPSPGYTPPQYPPQYLPSVGQNGSQQQQLSSEAFLSDAFPNIDRATVKAILGSTKGEIDPAYNALIAISGPGAASSNTAASVSQSFSPPPPSLPPRPAQSVMHQSSSGYLQPQPPSSSPCLPPYSPGSYSHDHTTSYSSHQQHGIPAPTSSISTHYPSISGSTTPVYVPASPNFDAINHALPPPQSSMAASPAIPDMSTLNLNNTTSQRRCPPIHMARCDGCKVDPIKGNRWICTECGNYDLCDKCRAAGTHNHHALVLARVGLEWHSKNWCDSCGTAENGQIQGIRYVCMTHTNEDYCEECINSGRACGGPFKQIKQTEMGRQLEEDGCLPMPPGWIPYLTPPVASYSVEHCPSPSSWLDWPDGFAWFTQPRRERYKGSFNPVYKFEMTGKTGRVPSDHTASWIMKKADGTKLYTFAMETDWKTYTVKHQQFSPYKGKATSPVWQHGPQQDSLSFQDPNNGIQYCWRSNRPISTLNNERYDFQRLALFERKSNQERMVADFAFWDGHPSGSGDCLMIRDRSIDHAIVIASLTIVLQHHWRIMQEEQERDPHNVADTAATAGLTRRGCAFYWERSTKPTVTTSSAASTNTTHSQKPSLTQNLKTATKIMDLANTALTMSAASGGGGGGGGGA